MLKNFFLISFLFVSFNAFSEFLVNKDSLKFNEEKFTEINTSRLLSYFASGNCRVSDLEISTSNDLNITCLGLNWFYKNIDLCNMKEFVVEIDDVKYGVFLIIGPKKKYYTGACYQVDSNDQVCEIKPLEIDYYSKDILLTLSNKDKTEELLECSIKGRF